MDFFWNNFEPITSGIKIAVMAILLLHVAPIMAWVERRGSALMQNRLGPNRIGPLGLLQSLADGIKFIFKEDVVPGHVTKFYYLLAPIVLVTPAFMTFAVIPYASQIAVDGHLLKFQVADLNVGLLYIFAIASLGVYGIIMGGWASNNKYALLGSLRSSVADDQLRVLDGPVIVGIIMLTARESGRHRHRAGTAEPNCNIPWIRAGVPMRRRSDHPAGGLPHFLRGLRRDQPPAVRLARRGVGDRGRLPSRVRLDEVRAAADGRVPEHGHGLRPVRGPFFRQLPRPGLGGAPDHRVRRAHGDGRRLAARAV